MEQKKIFDNIRKLTAYGILTGLVPEEDKIYTINRLLELFQLQEIDDSEKIWRGSLPKCWIMHMKQD